MQPDPWQEAPRRLQAALHRLLLETPPLLWDEQLSHLQRERNHRLTEGTDGLRFLRRMPGGYVVGDHELLDYAMPPADGWPEFPARR